MAIIYYAYLVVLKTCMAIAVSLITIAILYLLTCCTCCSCCKCCSKGLQFQKEEIFSLSNFVLASSAIFSISYSGVNIGVLKEIGTSTYKTLSLVNYALNLYFAPMQVVCILMLHASLKSIYEKRTEYKKRLIACLCLLDILSIFNFGLWASDSVGEIQKPLFTRPQYEKLGEDKWRMMVKLLLPGTIFFRFHCAMDIRKLQYHLLH